MKFVPVTSDISITEMALGTASYGTGFNESDSFAQMDAFFEAGGRTFDTARVYGLWAPDGNGASERMLGKWVASRGVRDSVVISTKGAHHDLADIHHKRVTPEDIRSDLSESLDALGMDHTDLYFLHRDDESVPVSEIMDVLDEFCRKGLVKVLGVSNWTTARIWEANAYASSHNRTPFSISQIEWSYAKLDKQIYGPEDNTVFMTDSEFDWYLSHDFPVMGYSSQAKGFFSKMLKGIDSLRPGMREVYGTPLNVRRFERACVLAEKYSVPVSRIALAYILRSPLKGCAIIGASVPEQLADSLQAASVALTEDEWNFLNND